MSLVHVVFIYLANTPWKGWSWSTCLTCTMVWMAMFILIQWTTLIRAITPKQSKADKCEPTHSNTRYPERKHALLFSLTNRALFHHTRVINPSWPHSQKIIVYGNLQFILIARSVKLVWASKSNLVKGHTLKWPMCT